MRLPSRLHRVAVLVAASAVALACRGGDASPARRTLIDSRDTEDPRSLDPALSTDVPTGRAVAYLFDGLYRFTPDARVEPALAERTEVSADGLVYTVHLRPGVTFHDGRPLVARNVVNSFRRVLDPASRGGRGWPLYPIRGAREYSEGKATTIEGLSAPDDSTVIITLATPLSIFEKMLAMPVASIVPDSVPANFSEKPVGTGPWKLVEWKHDDYILFARNEKYFGGAPKMDSLLSRVIPEPSTAVAEFESGRVDIINVPEAETRQWTQTDDRKAMLQSVPGLRFIYAAINVSRGPLADVRVRRAINHAVDARAILDQIVGGRGRLANGVIPPLLDGADSARRGYAHDIARAKALLAEAGHPNGIDIELWTSQAAPYPRIAETIQSMLQPAGIRVKIQQRDAPSVREASRKGQTDMHLKTWYADYPDAENFLFPLLHGSNMGVGGNVSFWKHAEYDRIVTQSRAERDAATRVRLYRQADSIAFNEAPMLFLFFYDELYALQPWIKGFVVPTIFNGQRWTDVVIEKR